MGMQHVAAQEDTFDRVDLGSENGGGAAVVVFYRPSGASSHVLWATHGLRRGLQSVVASRLRPSELQTLREMLAFLRPRLGLRCASFGTGD